MEIARLALLVGTHVGQPSVVQPVHRQRAVGQDEAAGDGNEVCVDASKMMERALVTLRLVNGMQRQHRRLLSLQEHAARKP
jgi:hypothetical protein